MRVRRRGEEHPGQTAASGWTKTPSVVSTSCCLSAFGLRRSSATRTGRESGQAPPCERPPQHRGPEPAVDRQSSGDKRAATGRPGRQHQRWGSAGARGQLRYRSSAAPVGKPANPEVPLPQVARIAGTRSPRPQRRTVASWPKGFSLREPCLGLPQSSSPPDIQVALSSGLWGPAGQVVRCRGTRSRCEAWDSAARMQQGFARACTSSMS
jgi:hypothetical protein